MGNYPLRLLKKSVKYNIIVIFRTENFTNFLKLEINEFQLFLPRPILFHKLREEKAW